MFDSEPFGDHCLAIGVRADEHQTLRAQRWRSREQIRQLPMGVSRSLMPDPSRSTDIGNALFQIAIEIAAHMLKEMVRHARSPIFDRQRAFLTDGMLGRRRPLWPQRLIGLCRRGCMCCADGIAQLAFRRFCGGDDGGYFSAKRHLFGA
jgi:hypothetical protein